MIPLQDSIQSRTTPVVNYAVIALTAVVFLLQLKEPEGDQKLVENYAMIPARVRNPEAKVEIPVSAERNPRTGQVTIHREEIGPPVIPPIFTMLTCVFLHGGWMHFLGNMWFLVIFGDNVEDRLGHIGYLIFYLASGVAASAVHLLSDPGSTVPTVGASGAIAGVMGAYFFWFRHSYVRALLPLGAFTQVLVVPAPVFLGIWFVMQLIPGIGSVTGGASEGVAWWAHIGGFVVGAVVAVLVGRQETPPYEPRHRPAPAWRY